MTIFYEAIHLIHFGLVAFNFKEAQSSDLQQMSIWNFSLYTKYIQINANSILVDCTETERV